MLPPTGPIAHLQGEMHLITAPAKINLSLKVLGKRDDGYHAIETLMAPLSLADTVALERADSFSFHCNEPGIPLDESNLVVKAAILFYRALGEAPRVSITLEKRVPHGAGLGGGSSDAAATLLGLNKLREQEGFPPLPMVHLATLAAEIGSDVPFFLVQGPAVCTGRGEIVEPLPAGRLPADLPLLLVKPAFGIPTPWAYKQWATSQPIPGFDYSAQPFPWGDLVNDLERPVFEKYLFLATLRQWLRQQPESRGALMSGSGATCFALLHNATNGPALEARAQAQFGPLWTNLCFANPTSCAPAP